MSTRACVVVKDDHDHLVFYRHSDGYPRGVFPTLSAFIESLKKGCIRDNVTQSAGWLIHLGSIEYNTFGLPKSKENSRGWKVGAYEPTPDIHSDIEYLYVIDLSQREVFFKALEFGFSASKEFKKALSLEGFKPLTKESE